VTPEEQEAVRRALAATPPVGPMPSEVVARLEATIADLAAVRAAERSAGDPDATPAPVSQLEERRRRRWPRPRAPAASVVLVGYGVGAVLQDAGPHAETAMSGSADDESGAGSSVDRSADGGAAAPEAAEPPGAQGLPEETAAGRVVELSAATLRRDVLRHLEAQRSTATADRTDALDTLTYAQRGGPCEPPEDVRAGDDVSAARLDGRRATLVVRPSPQE
jgi:hypothetical protein